MSPSYKVLGGFQSRQVTDQLQHFPVKLHTVTKLMATKLMATKFPNLFTGLGIMKGEYKNILKKDVKQDLTKLNRSAVIYTANLSPA